MAVCIATMFLAWHFQARAKAKIDVANEQVSRAVTAAESWLSHGSPDGGDLVQRELESALALKEATTQQRVSTALARVQRRRHQFGLMSSAQQLIEARKIRDAVAVLRDYLSQPDVTELERAQRLLKEAEIAASDQLTLQYLIEMSDRDFEVARSTQAIHDGLVTDGRLSAVRAETIARNLAQAAEQRDARRVEEQRRVAAANAAAQQLERERLAQLERERLAEAARIQARANPIHTPEIEDVANFPDRFIGEFVCLKSVAIDGDIERNPLTGDMFCVALKSRRKKFFTGWGLDLIVTAPDSLAEPLLKDIRADLVFARCDVYCEIGNFDRNGQKITHAKIYRIDVYNFGGKIGKSYCE